MSEVVLTKNQSMVHNVLTHDKGPMTAYEILDILRDKGLRAPLQVYRALEKLTELKLVHRLESMSAFVACQHGTCEHSGAAVFAICETCGAVAELEAADLCKDLETRVMADGFNPKKTTIELRGECQQCYSG